jgi:hypothetical protein
LCVQEKEKMKVCSQQVKHVPVLAVPIARQLDPYQT